jgi:hypothetical protein
MFCYHVLAKAGIGSAWLLHGGIRMATVLIEVPKTPHGHGLSSKKGVMDGLRGDTRMSQACMKRIGQATGVDSIWEQS